ncbi:muts domain III-domain-containing protein [Aspergillus alliaceus]|uniref:muts domain III-domain-containing protein n=1 Tax=Petromyces alliaceus TaxID=209559 RepID=UPI0012A3B464|nr:muts domain III-domain-containing protein [Aspergillus alliaceus]KAB8233451.1 muts domain III-domain-containing protein [Aspergillus alliaceus]
MDRLAFPEDVESIKITLGGTLPPVALLQYVEENTCASLAEFLQVLKYVELELNKTFTSYSLRIRFEPSQGSMLIDLSSIVSLELIQNLQNAMSKDSLFGLLNETLTPMGGRLLRANILQPSTEVSKLLARYDAVEDLSTKGEMFASVSREICFCDEIYTNSWPSASPTALKGLIDADKVS